MLWKFSVCGMKVIMWGTAPRTCHSGCACLYIFETSSQQLLFVASASFLAHQLHTSECIIGFKQCLLPYCPSKKLSCCPSVQLSPHPPSLESSSVYIYQWCAQRQTLSGIHCNCPNYPEFICIRRLTSLR